MPMIIKRAVLFLLCSLAVSCGSAKRDEPTQASQVSTMVSLATQINVYKAKNRFIKGSDGTVKPQAEDQTISEWRIDEASKKPLLNGEKKRLSSIFGTDSYSNNMGITPCFEPEFIVELNQSGTKSFIVVSCECLCVKIFQDSKNSNEIIDPIQITEHTAQKLKEFYFDKYVASASR